MKNKNIPTKVKLKPKTLEITFDYLKDKENLEIIYTETVDEINSKGIPLELIYSKLNFRTFLYYKIKKNILDKLPEFSSNKKSKTITFGDKESEKIIKFI